MPSTIRHARGPAGRATRLAGLGVATLLVLPQAWPARAAADPAPATAATSTATPTASPVDPALANRIAALHQQLAITPAQETLWSDFTAVMRQNAGEIDGALAARKAQFGTMNAVADLQSYADFTAKRSAELARLVPPFTALYNSMSPSQKATADRVFRNNADRGVRRSTPPR